MDLFGDLPDPLESTSTGSSTISVESKNGKKRASLDEAVVEEKKIKCDEKKIEESKTYKKHKYKLKGYVSAQKGEREEMQDAHVLLNDYTSHIPQLHPSISRLALYCVFDGHGGSRASRFASSQLHIVLRDTFPKGDVNNVEKEIRKTFIETFKSLDENFLHKASKNKPSWKDGTTAVSVLVINDTMYIANLGDSKAILCRYNKTSGKYTALPLTTDHSPSVYEERKRIQKAGGTVREGRVMGILEVSRSLGDGPYKNHGVSCLPDIKRCQLTDDDRYLMVACDGLWKSFTMEESIKFVNNILDTGEDCNSATQFETACTKLTSEAVLRLSGDNVTVILTSIYS
ncbi:hypothetical protein SNE40_015687 [Patella caerulea]|uniref:PPM-type phosphatase domain-containing protein n=1 Tax=Patella caerulea TaxID=87958 RepID=A0AAN8PSE6_PATCE